MLFLKKLSFTRRFFKVCILKQAQCSDGDKTKLRFILLQNKVNTNRWQNQRRKSNYKG